MRIDARQLLLVRTILTKGSVVDASGATEEETSFWSQVQ